MRKISITLLSAVLLSGAATAQREIGIATSNWSGTRGLYYDPSSIADANNKFTIDLFSVNFLADNNLGTISTGNLIKKFYNGKDVALSDVWAYGNKTPFSMTAPYVSVSGPGFMWNIDHKNSVALTTGLRGFSQFTNIDKTLFLSIADPNSITGGMYHLTSQNYAYTASLWSEIGLSYARVLLDKGKNELKVGITLRYLGGVGYVNVSGKNLDVDVNSNNDDITLRPTNDLTYNSNILNSTNNLSSNVTASDFLNTFLGKKGGSGIGGDIGISYEYRPDYDKYKYDMDGKTNIMDYSVPRYKLKVFASVTDIGSIMYKAANNKQAKVSGTGTLTGDTLKSRVQNYDDFVNYAQSQGITVTTANVAAVYHLPTALVLGADYKIAGGFFANAMFIGNLANKNAIGNYYSSQVTVTPRYDTRVFSVGVPITYSMLSKSLKAGVGARVAGFFLGSDDMLSLFSKGQYGFNMYFGAYVPINYRKPKDSDHDHVSNKYDKCPGVVGTWEFHGCPDPDQDHDGVPDSIDKCPTVAGSPTAHGCPDKDLDSVADAQDRCPDQAGPVALQGCPDRDHDGIPDIDDACPDQAGPAKYHGCPDTDGDGIPDNEDACPDKAGPIVFKGCPDTDGDGVPDNIDKCPTVPGPADNQGCPRISEQVKKRLAFAATAIQFQTGKAVIKPASYPLLNEIVKILNDYPDYYMTIDGHTDNVGKPEKNMVLSRGRAESVKNYFVSQGIKANRLTTAGHGDTEPVASNKTAAGRAKNRRVAMDLKLMQGK